MKSQTRILVFAITTCAVSVASANSLFQVGDTAIRFLGGISYVSEDNIYLRSVDEVSDWRVEFDAGLEFKLAPEGAASTSLIVTNRWVKYQNEPLDENFLKAHFNNTYNSGIVLSNVYANYKEDYSSRWDADTVSDVYGVLIRWDSLTTGGNRFINEH